LDEGVAITLVIVAMVFLSRPELNEQTDAVFAKSTDRRGAIPILIAVVRRYSKRSLSTFVPSMRINLKQSLTRGIVPWTPRLP
jgi:hypothetical protein